MNLNPVQEQILDENIEIFKSLLEYVVNETTWSETKAIQFLVWQMVYSNTKISNLVLNDKLP